MNIYAQNILDRYKKPFYREIAINPQIKHIEANHACGDKVEIQIELKDGNIKGYSWTGSGCAISMASADMLGDLIEGISPEDTMKLTKDKVYEMLGIEISVRRSKCALLALLAIQNGLLENARKEKRSWSYFLL